MTIHLSYKDDQNSPISLCRSTLIESLTTCNGNTVELVGVDDSIKELTEFLRKVIIDGESNSLLLYGSHGSGKSTALSFVLNSICTESINPILVKLNGHVHVDDRLSLLDMMWQFRKALPNIQDRFLRAPRSFSESLKWLVSFQESNFSTFDDNSVSPIVFILDEFEAFTTHPKQALLYNLFDLVHTNIRPIAVIGLTSRWDAVELLEKRVRSRFSNRQIHLKKIDSISTFLYVIQKRLSLPDDFVFKSYAESFNEKIEIIMQDASMLQLLEQVYNIHGDIRSCLHSFIPAICKLSPENSFLSIESLTEACKEQLCKSYLMDILQGICLLELSLLMSIYRLMKIDILIFNFELVYNEYKSFYSRNSSEALEHASKYIALKGFERLINSKLVHYVHIGGNVPLECKPCRLGIMMHQIADVVNLRNDCPLMLKNWITL